MELHIEYGTVAVTEVLWTAVLAWGAIRHNNKRRELNRRIVAAEKLDDPPPTQEALALYQNDRDTETDLAAFKTILLLAGPLNMLRENGPMTPASFTTVTILFGAVLFLRIRSERRERRREAAIPVPQGAAGRKAHADAIAESEERNPIT